MKTASKVTSITETQEIVQGSTIAYFNADTLYQGVYFVKIKGQNGSKKIVIQ